MDFLVVSLVELLLRKSSLSTYVRRRITQRAREEGKIWKAIKTKDSNSLLWR